MFKRNDINIKKTSIDKDDDFLFNQMESDFEAFCGSLNDQEFIIKQDPIIYLMKSLDYPSDVKGVCVGLTCTWMIASFCDDEDLYNERLKLIKFIEQQKQFGVRKLSIKAIINRIIERKNEKQKLSPFEERLLDLKVFCAEIELIANINNHYSFVGDFIAQGDFEKITKLLAIPKLVEHEGMISIFSCPIIGTEKDINTILIALSKVLNTNKKPGARYNLQLHSTTHMMGMKASEENWLLVNPSQLPAKNIHGEKIGQLLISGFLNAKVTAFNIKIYTLGDNPYIDEMSNILAKFKEKHTAKISRIKTKPLVPGLITTNINIAHIAAMQNDSALIKKIIKKMPSLIYKADTNGQTPAHFAAQYGSQEVLESIAAYDKKLLFELTLAGTPLLVAISFGRAHLMSTFHKYQVLANKDLGLNSAVEDAVTFNQPQIIASLATLDPKYLVIEDEEGNSAVHFAVLQSLSCIEMIANINPALFNLQNKKGETPAHILIGNFTENKNQKLLVLAKFGVDFTVPDCRGKTPMDLFIQNCGPKLDAIQMAILVTVLAKTDKPINMDKILPLVSLDDLMSAMSETLISLPSRDELVASIKKIENKENMLGLFISEKIKEQSKVSFLEVINQLKKLMPDSAIIKPSKIKKPSKKLNAKKSVTKKDQFGLFKNDPIIVKHGPTNINFAKSLSDTFSEMVKQSRGLYPDEFYFVLTSLDHEMRELKKSNQLNEMVNLINTYVLKYGSTEINNFFTSFNGFMSLILPRGQFKFDLEQAYPIDKKFSWLTDRAEQINSGDVIETDKNLKK